jgi:transcription elongation factor Elf1
MKEHTTYCPHCSAGVTVIVETEKPSEIIANCEVCDNHFDIYVDPKSNAVFDLPVEVAA